MLARTNYAILTFSSSTINCPNFSPLVPRTRHLSELPCRGDSASIGGCDVDANAVSADESWGTDGVDLVNTSSLSGACVEALGIEL